MSKLVLAAVIGLLCAATQAHASGPTQSAAANQQEIDAGRRIYEQQCAACHGAKGEGQPGWERRNQLGELPAPPHDASGHTWKHADAMLYKTIRDGWRDPFDKTKRLTMPGYKQVLTPHETRAVINYLKTMWTPEQRRNQRADSKLHPFPSEAR